MKGLRIQTSVLFLSAGAASANTVLLQQSAGTTPHTRIPFSANDYPQPFRPGEHVPYSAAIAYTAPQQRHDQFSNDLFLGRQGPAVVAEQLPAQLKPGRIVPNSPQPRSPVQAPPAYRPIVNGAQPPYPPVPDIIVQPPTPEPELRFPVHQMEDATYLAPPSPAVRRSSSLRRTQEFTPNERLREFLNHLGLQSGRHGYYPNMSPWDVRVLRQYIAELPSEEDQRIFLRRLNDNFNESVRLDKSEFVDHFAEQARVMRDDPQFTFLKAHWPISFKEPDCFEDGALPEAIIYDAYRPQVAVASQPLPTQFATPQPRQPQAPVRMPSTTQYAVPVSSHGPMMLPQRVRPAPMNAALAAEPDAILSSQDRTGFPPEASVPYPTSPLSPTVYSKMKNVRSQGSLRRFMPAILQRNRANSVTLEDAPSVKETTPRSSLDRPVVEEPPQSTLYHTPAPVRPLPTQHTLYVTNPTETSPALPPKQRPQPPVEQPLGGSALRHDAAEEARQKEAAFLRQQQEAAELYERQRAEQVQFAERQAQREAQRQAADRAREQQLREDEALAARFERERQAQIERDMADERAAAAYRAKEEERAQRQAAQELADARAAARQQAEFDAREREHRRIEQANQRVAAEFQAQEEADARHKRDMQIVLAFQEEEDARIAAEIEAREQKSAATERALKEAEEQRMLQEFIHAEMKQRETDEEIARLLAAEDD